MHNLLKKALLCTVCCGMLSLGFASSFSSSSLAASKNISFPGVDTTLESRPALPGGYAITTNEDGTYTTDFSKLANRYVHDAEIIYGKGKNGQSHYFCFSTDIGDARIDAGIPIRISDDLVNWKCIGQVFNREEENFPKDISGFNYDETNSYIQTFQYTSLNASSNIWAPFVYDDTENSGYYYIYYSCSNSYGGRNSNIAVARSHYLDCEWEDCGILISSRFSDKDGYNAIDPSVISDKDGNLWMIYGSWFYGINCVQLNEKNPAELKTQDDKGTRIAARYNKKDNLGGYGIEGPAVIYNEETGYYYLFTSYDYLFYSYNVRVGRSENITGPYVDYNGNPLIYDEVSPNGKSEGFVAKDYDLHGTINYGNKLVGAYSFQNDVYGGWQGTAHNAIFKGEDGNYYLTHNSRPVSTPYITFMNLRKVIFNDEGWPMVSPEPYAGEVSKDSESIVKADITDGISEVQNWEFITLNRTNSPSDFSNGAWSFHPETSTIYQLDKNGKVFPVSSNTAAPVIGEVCGSWNLYGNNTFSIDLGDGNGTATGVLMYAWDSENWKESIVFTGITEKGISVWGKKCISKADTPVLSAASTTKDSITLTPIENAEYSMDNGATWQKSNVFTGLNANTSYRFIARVTSISVYTSDVSKEITVKTAADSKPTVTLNASSLTINGFGSAKLTIKKKSIATDTVKQYLSSKPKVVSVSSTGKLTAKGIGTSTITVKMKSGASASCKVTVKALAAKSVSLNKKSVTLKKGKSVTLKATLKPAASTSSLKWSSSKKGIATVKNGKVTGKKKGYAVITVKAGNKKASCKVKVK